MLAYFDHVSSFDELLKKDRSFSIHHRNIQCLAIEIYKFFHGLSPSIMKNVFHLNTKALKYGTETTSYLAPNVIKISKSLDVFKSKIR